MLTSDLRPAAPAPALRGSVLGYTGYAERTDAPVTRRQVAVPTVNVILSLGPAIDVDGERRTSFVAGVHPDPALTTFVGEQLGIQIELTPLGASRPDSTLVLPSRSPDAFGFHRVSLRCSRAQERHDHGYGAREGRSTQ